MCPCVAGISQTLELTEKTREKLLEEIAALNRERAEVTDQYNVVRTISHMSERKLGAKSITF